MLRSASLIILLVAIAATSADFECPDVEGIFPDPDDCRSFYQGSTLDDESMMTLIRVSFATLDLLAQQIKLFSC